MTIHFAAPADRFRSTLSEEQTRSWRKRPANDNGGAACELDEVLRSALSHLTQHGLDAPAAARRNAVVALEAGDREAYNQWVAICRKFDRRAAGALDRLSARVPDLDAAQSG